MEEYKNCTVCGKKNHISNCGSLSIHLDLLDPFVKKEMGWKVLDICIDCYPSTIEKINAMYDDILTNYFEKTMPL